MNEKNFEIESTFYLENPIRQIMNYFIVGFIFTCVQINDSILPDISLMISSLCFYFGLRRLRKENRYFNFSWMIELFFAVVAFIKLVLAATPYVLPVQIIYILSALRLINILIISLGLKRILDNKKKYALWFMSLYLGMYFMFLLSVQDMIYLVVAFLLFFILIGLLVKMKVYLMNYKFDIHYAPIYRETWKLTLQYIGTMILCIVIATTVLPYHYYHYIPVPKIDYSSLQVLDTMQQKHLKMTGTIYDYDDQNHLYVFDMEWQPKKKYTAIDISFANGYSYNIYPNVEVESFYVSDGKNYLEYTQKDIPPKDLFTKAKLNIPIHPDQEKLYIHFAVKIEKLKKYGQEYQEGLGSMKIDIDGYNYAQYPYSQPVAITSCYTTVEGAKWGHE